jgi:hypothetical protein
VERATESARQMGRAPSKGSGARAESFDAPLHPMLRLQRQVGNQAVLAMLRSGALQAKLSVGAVDDPLEHEADRVADQVMRMPDPALTVQSAPPQISRKCAACAEEDKEKMLRMKPAEAVGPAGGEAPHSVHDVLGSSGQPLDAATRAFFEPRFGRDFSDVRVHTGSAAGHSARGVNANAYTVGKSIVFGTGHFAPGTDEGRGLFAHELTHVVQQSGLNAIDTRQTESYRSLPPISIRRKASAVLRRFPTAPGSAAYDRSKIVLGDVPDFVATKGTIWTFPKNTVPVTVNESSVASIVWEFFDPLDQLAQGFGTMPGSPQVLTKPFDIDLNNLIQPVVQGRYTLRCTGLDASHKNVVYADRSFFIWTSTPGSLQDLTALNAVRTAPSAHSLGEVGAAEARAMMLEHQDPMGRWIATETLAE